VTFNLAKSDLLTLSRKEDCAAFRNETPILLDIASTTTAPVVSRRGRPRKTAEPKAPQPLLEYCLMEHPHPPIFFGGARLTESASIKMVGLTVSATLSWSVHIRKTAAHASRAVALLRRAKPFLSRATLCTIYKTFVRSRMEYCSPLWMGAPASALRLLDRVQARAVKIMGKKTVFTLQYLSHRRGVSAMCLLHRILHGAAPPPLLDLCPPRAPPRRSTRANPPFFALPPTKRTDAKFYARSFLPLLSSFFNSSIPPHLQAETRLQPFKEAVNDSVDMTFL